MAVGTVTQLIDQLRQSRLLTPPQLDEIARGWAKRFPESRALAQALVERGWLTAFQARQALLGQAAELTLGPYAILDRLGEGGNGQVFKARHRAMNRLVALKLLRADAVSDAEAVARFSREIEVASHISHPNIVHALDAGPMGSGLVLAMEYVEGVDLHQLVKGSGPLPVAQACDFIRQAALGLQHAHERGLVHRDIKPSNLLLKRSSASGSSDFESGPWGQIKILDLGLARLLQPAAASPTRNLTVLAGNSVMQGTPDYMAPEQAVDFHHADIRSDIYSLGCTFYYLLTGQAPFAGVALTEKLLKHQTAEPRPVQEFRNDLPPAVGPVLDRMLAKRPKERYQTPAEVAAALSGLTRPDPLTGISTRLTSRLTLSTQRLLALARFGKRRRLLAVLAGLFVIVGLAWLATFMFSGSGEPERVDPTAAIRDPGFETPSVGVGFHDAFRGQAKGSAWAFRGSAGVTGNASGFTNGNPNAPEGTQSAFLQGSGGMMQKLALSAGTYQLEFQAAQRKNVQASSQTFRVLLDGDAIGSFEPRGNAYAGYATGPFTVTEGEHTIAFEGLNPRGGDNTVFIDMVQFVQAGQAKAQPAWTVADPAVARSAGGATLTRQPDGSWLASGKNPPSDLYQVAFSTPLTGITGVRLEVLPHPSLPSQGPGRAANGNIVLSQFRVSGAVRGQEGADRPVVLSKALADHAQAGFPITNTLEGDLKKGWALLPHVGKPHVAIYELAELLGHPEGTTLIFHLQHSKQHPDHNIGRFRLAVTTRKPPLGLADP